MQHRIYHDSPSLFNIDRAHFIIDIHGMSMTFESIVRSRSLLEELVFLLKGVNEFKCMLAFFLLCPEAV